MTHGLLHIILSLGLTGAIAMTGHAQTCRVNIGSPHPGCENYIEVYEYDYVTDKPCFPEVTAA